MSGPDGWEGSETIRRAIEIRDGVVQNPRILSFQKRAPEYPHRPALIEDDGRRHRSMADLGDVSRGVQLRCDLPLPSHRRRQGRPLDLRRVRRRAVVADHRRARSVRPTSRRSASCSCRSTATTSRGRRGAGCCTSTSAPTPPSAPRSRTSSPDAWAARRSPVPVGVQGEHPACSRPLPDRDRPHPGPRMVPCGRVGERADRRAVRDAEPGLVHHPRP